MTQEDKQLLLVDLCCRLPYLTKVKCPFDDEPYTLLSINWDKEIVVIGFMNVDTYVTSKQKLVKIKPYLRPMSSMTEEEEQEYSFLLNDGGWGVSENLISDCIDWLNAHHFDYKGLIGEGLAISTEEFNPYY